MMKYLPGGSWHSGFLKNYLHTIFVLGQCQCFRACAGKCKTEHLQLFGYKPLAMINSRKAFTPVKNNMLKGVKNCKRCRNIIIFYGNKNSRMTYINQGIA